MHHVAIMKKSWGLIPKILSGEKTIESRWYQTRRAPWDRVQQGDTIYFKNSGEPVSSTATVSNVLQFELHSYADAQKIVKEYGKEICMINRDPKTWGKLPRYCILLFLTKPKSITLFDISKKGFGNANAWLTVPSINAIKTK
jgi:hypothetical protein